MTLRLDYGKVSPGAAEGMYGTNAYLDDAPIDQVLRRLVELRVSQINGCHYCIWLHARQARDLGETEARIQAVADWRGAGCFDEAESAAFAWTESVTRISGGVPPDDQFAALGAYFDDRQIVDLTAVIANMNALNRVAISFRLEPPG
ncbi:MAG: AhpD family alkylhydroperoxidase [Paracoccaceae bacterium]|jgi:AhpD family alkylhydroperoxidase